MTPFDKFLDIYGIWVGLGIYILIKDILPFLFGKFIPGRIKSMDEQRKDRVAELSQEREWQHQIETERQETLGKISEAVQTLAISMAQTNTNMVTIASGQDRMLSKQDMHHNEMMEAIGDMRAVTATRNKKSKVSAMA